MADFGAWGPVELKVTLGEILTAVAAGAAWWVGHVIQRRQANERAIKDLDFFVQRPLHVLDQLSELSRRIAPGGGSKD